MSTGSPTRSPTCASAGSQRSKRAKARRTHWVAHVGDLASQTLRYTCGSWYLGANVPGKPRVFMPYIGGFPRYVAQCSDVAANGYEGFTLR